jgi:D-xylose 1-dehydrogenase (NADP+, D-xylono-1,5-lactone-forming)
MAISWGILGTARTNRRFLAAAAATDRAEVLAVASRSPDAAREFAAERDIPRAYGSYDELLGDPEVEAVYVPLPNALHLEWTRRALDAGKHVLCEKPLGADPVAVAEAFDLAASAGLVLAEGMMYRHHPQTRRLRELLDAGAIGEPRALRAHFSFAVADPANVRLSAELAGGALMDIGCYCTDIACLVGGEPTAAVAERVLGPSGVDVRFAGGLEFAGGMLAQFLVAFDLPKRMEVAIHGSDGSLVLPDPWHCLEPGIELHTEAGVERIAIPEADPYLLQLEDACAAIGGAEPLLGRADAVRQAGALALLERAAGASD